MKVTCKEPQTEMVLWADLPCGTVARIKKTQLVILKIEPVETACGIFDYVVLNNPMVTGDTPGTLGGLDDTISIEVPVEAELLLNFH